MTTTRERSISDTMVATIRSQQAAEEKAKRPSTLEERKAWLRRARTLLAETPFSSVG